MAQLAKLAGRRESGAFYLAWARDHQTRFNEALWDDDRGVVRGVEDAPEAALGQVLAASLAPAVLPQERAMRLLEHLRRERMTPLGLREDPSSARAGTTWLGPFLIGWLRAHQRSEAARAQAREWLAPFIAGLERGAPGILATVEPAPGAGEASPSAAAAAPQLAGDPFSVLAAADLLRLWIEEMDHPA